MKTNIVTRWIVTPLLAFVMMACNESDFLDTKNPNSTTDINYWKTEADVQSAMATVYSPIRGQMYGYFGAFTGFQNMNVRADDTWAIVMDDPETWQIATFTNTPNTGRDDMSYIYKCIQRANVLLDKIDNVPMEDTKRVELKAEAAFLRGLSYFLLVTNYGNVPIHLKPTGLTSDDMMVASSPEAEVWAQVEADLKVAKEGLPITRPAGEGGRVTKGAAIAYLGKTYIFQQKYAEGEAELRTIMQPPYTYDLVPNYDDNFSEMNELNQESVFELCYDGKYGNGSWGQEGSNDTQGMVLPNFIGPPATSGWFKVMPTASLIDEFTIERRPAGSDTKFDKRMYSSFYFKYSDYGDVKTDEKWYGNSFTFDDLWDSGSAKRGRGEPDYPLIDGTKGRFLYKKYTNWWADSQDGNSMYNQKNQNNNYRVMRFSEVLLLHAEACVKNGKLAEAATDITRVRDRAGLAKKTWAGADDLMKEIEHQKLLEFCLEGVRFFDLKRWYGYEGMKQIFDKNKKQGAEFFQPKHLYYPIQQAEMNTNTAIEQHPLWK